ncbi:MAG TPA: putative maltokinase, partial [Polyangiaceae bacterium]
FMIDGPMSDAPIAVVVLAIAYEDGGADRYVIPLASVDRAGAEAMRKEQPGAVVATLDNGGALVDGLATGHAAAALLGFVRNERMVKSEGAQLRGRSSQLLREVAGVGPLAATVHGAEQTNSTIAFGQRVLFKAYRQLTKDDNIELEMGNFLTEHSDPPCAPRVLGDIEYRSKEGAPHALAIAHEFVTNEGDAWTFALRHARAWLEAPSGKAPAIALDSTVEELLAHALGPADGAHTPFVASAETLGRRTAELHLALASDARNPKFAPEELSIGDREAMAARATAMLEQNLEALSSMRDRLPPESRRLAERLLEPKARQGLAGSVQRFREEKGTIIKVRTHGDLHLGQVLVRGNDFMIIDFEGEPARPLSERRAKNSPLRDVMGMARSFDYAPEAVLRESSFAGARGDRQPLARQWTADATRGYLRGYLQTAGRAPFVPQDRRQLANLLTFYQLEKVIYEIGYEVNNRPDWVEIPLRGLAGIALPEGR